jgi:hypothetical protein
MEMFSLCQQGLALNGHWMMKADNATSRRHAQLRICAFIVTAAEICEWRASYLAYKFGV